MTRRKGEKLCHFDNLVPYMGAILPQVIAMEDNINRIKMMLTDAFLVNLENYRKENLNEFIRNQMDEFKGQAIQQVPREDVDKERRLLLSRFKRWDKKLKKEDTSNVKGKIQKSSGPKKRRNIPENHMSKAIVKLSRPLQNLLGINNSTRTEVVKLIWVYIRENNLQNPEDKREVICDDPMKVIFGEKVTIFSMNKLLLPHIIKLSDSEQNDITSHAESLDTVNSTLDSSDDDVDLDDENKRESYSSDSESSGREYFSSEEPKSNDLNS